MDRKTVVITGSTRGIGLAAALHCFRSGASVVISSEDEIDLEDALAGFGGDTRAAGVVCDVAKREDVKKLRDTALKKFGAVDVWINNAGMAAPSGNTDEVSMDRGTRLIETNILGAYYGSMTAVRLFKRQGHGRLINMLGRGRNGPVPTANLYGSSKAWIKNFTNRRDRPCQDSPFREKAPCNQ